MGALVFVVTASLTIAWCQSMAPGMRMPGGWTMSMAWMRMPGQSRLGAAATFMSMWTVMMVAMMVPSLVSMLAEYRRSIREPAAQRLGRLTALAAAGYFSLWALLGAPVYVLGVAVSDAVMRWPELARQVPLGTGLALVLAGSVQLTRWKARHLRHGRDQRSCGPSAASASAWRHGLHLGLHCSLCCSGFMLVLLVTDVMDLRFMAAVAAAITAERLAPAPVRLARALGVAVITAGVVVIARTLGVV